jgi:hypothetical protein
MEISVKYTGDQNGYERVIVENDGKETGSFETGDFLKDFNKALNFASTVDSSGAIWVSNTVMDFLREEPQCYGIGDEGIYKND